MAVAVVVVVRMVAVILAVNVVLMRRPHIHHLDAHSTKGNMLHLVCLLGRMTPHPHTMRMNAPASCKWVEMSPASDDMQVGLRLELLLMKLCKVECGAR